MSSIMRARSGLTGRFEDWEVIGGSSLKPKVAGPSMLGIGCPNRHAFLFTRSPTPPENPPTSTPPSREGGFVRCPVAAIERGEGAFIRKARFHLALGERGIGSAVLPVTVRSSGKARSCRAPLYTTRTDNANGKPAETESAQVRRSIIARRRLIEPDAAVLRALLTGQAAAS